MPAGGDEPDPEINPKFAHKLAFLDEMRAHAGLLPEASQRAILVGDLNVAPLEHDVWSHKQMLKVVSHTPIECEKLDRRAEGRQLDRRHARAHARAGEALHLVELSRDGQLETADRGRRLDHVWASHALADRVAAIKIAKDYRGAARPSDHVPVTATVEV